MKRVRRLLWGDRRGAAIVEFALAIPVLILFIVGLAQIAILFQANAGLQHAVGEGARFATIYPEPSDSAIIARVTDKKFGLDPAFLTGPTVSHGVANGIDYAEVTMSYAVPLDFIVFTGPAVTLSSTRRAFQP